MRSAGWNNERIELLKKLWAEGYSASQIAARIRGFTRSAIIGKVHRLGLSGRKVVYRKRSGPRHKKRRIGALTTKLHTNGIPAFARYDLPSPAETDIARVSFNDLDEQGQKHCKWICKDPLTVGQDQPLYCGAERIPGLSYCRDHAIRALNPIELRKAGIVVSSEKELA